MEDGGVKDSVPTNRRKLKREERTLLSLPSLSSFKWVGVNIDVHEIVSCIVVLQTDVPEGDMIVHDNSKTEIIFTFHSSHFSNLL